MDSSFFFFPFVTLSLSHSLSHIHTHSLTHSLTHSIPHSLTPSLTHSLKHLHTQTSHFFSLFISVFKWSKSSCRDLGKLKFIVTWFEKSISQILFLHSFQFECGKNVNEIFLFMTLIKMTNLGTIWLQIKVCQTLKLIIVNKIPLF